jgi:hypothetical protein
MLLDSALLVALPALALFVPSVALRRRHARIQGDRTRGRIPVPAVTSAPPVVAVLTFARGRAHQDQTRGRVTCAHVRRRPVTAEVTPVTVATGCARTS